MLKDLISLFLTLINPTKSRKKVDTSNNPTDKTKGDEANFDSAISGLLKTMNKFSICLNSRSIENISYFNLNKVCFILINTYENENEDLGIGPLNDGIHIALQYHRLHYKVYYLYNPKSSQFIEYLEFFLKNTSKALTVFYSGNDLPNNDVHEIIFKNEKLQSCIVKKAISQNYNGKAKVMFITNSFNGGTVFDIQSIKHSNNQQSSNIISFWVKKEMNDLKQNEHKKSHGIFIYYFCKIISDSPKISPKELADKINPSICGFNEYLKYDISNPNLIEAPLLQ